MKRLQYRFSQFPIAGALITFLAFGQVALPPAPAVPRRGLSDRDVTLAVERRLMLDDGVPAQRIDVSTEDGVVTLSGSVRRLSAKLAAGYAAETVRGVVGVFNDIEVEPAPRLDSHIRGDVIAALTDDPVTDVVDIEVSVKDGVVTLSGAVDSAVERSVAEQLAQGVAGVVDVRNLLARAELVDRPDAAIVEDIQNRLRVDAAIASGLITVSIDDGEVTLAGGVRSAAERRRVEEQVWTVPGVRAVENNIDVQWWRADEVADWPDPWTDGLIREAIEEALRRNPRVDAAEIATTVRERVAVLMGTVDTLRAKRAAEAEAQNVLGVRSVRSRLRVQPAETREDDAVAQDIREAIERSPELATDQVTVRVDGGVAYLSGEVDSQYLKAQAEAAAAAVPGVVDIQNDVDAPAGGAAKSDREIRENIESSLAWEPRIDANRVAVDVRAGVATLKGTVDSLPALRAAEQSARRAGATSVVSNLEVNRSNAND